MPTRGSDHDRWHVGIGHPIEGLNGYAECRSAVILGTTTETSDLEFKGRYDKGPGPDEVRKDLSSLANTRGGTILVGIAEVTNEANYQVADSYCSIDIEATKKRIADSMATGVYPLVDFWFAQIPVSASPPVTVLAVLVRPNKHAPVCCYDTDTNRASFYYRDDRGVKSMEPAEFSRRYSRSRAIQLSLSELAPGQVKLRVFSPVVVRYEESELEWQRRMKTEGNTWPGADVPSIHRKRLLERSIEMAALLRRFDDDTLTLLMDSLEFKLPIGAIDEIWRTEPGEVGVVFRCTIVLPQQSSVGGSVNFRFHSG